MEGFLVNSLSFSIFDLNWNIETPKNRSGKKQKKKQKQQNKKKNKKKKKQKKKKKKKGRCKKCG